MKAIVYDQYGPAKKLKYSEIETPDIKDNEILVEVYASSVNPVDWKVRQGNLKPVSGIKFPKQSGSDFAGKVKRVGLKVQDVKPGNEVYGMVSPLKGGAFGEFVVAKKGQYYLKPDNISFAEAAAIPMAGLTALQALRDKAKISRGQKVLINGCTGGVGSFAVQIAKSYNTYVSGTCRTDHIDIARKLGADEVIDYTKQSIYDQGKEYDIIFDAVGKLSFAKARHLLRKGGTFVTTLPRPDNILSGLFFGTGENKRFRGLMAKSTVEDLHYLTTLCEREHIKPLVYKVFPVIDTDKAQEKSETGHIPGKVIVAVKDEAMQSFREKTAEQIVEESKANMQA